jgi:hypothetical protein
MKRQLLFLIVAGGIALMGASRASAFGGPPSPGFCGNNYAMLLQGAEPNTNPATAAPGNPGALTAIVGVGVIQFSRNCKTISGELIYNDGDVQFAQSGVGVFAGPTVCYAGESLLAGLPCFDGGNHFSAGSVSTAGEPPGLVSLQFTANFNFYNLSIGAPAGSIPFVFNIHETGDDSILVGNTVPAPTAPVLTVTMQKQSSFGFFFGPFSIGTTFGRPPYAGHSAIACTGYGANDDDLIALISNGDSGGVSGSYGNAIGSVQIFPNGKAAGLLSFNGNDNLQVAGSTAPPSNNSACAFSEILDPYDGAAAFKDGTSNLLSSITSAATDPTCTNAANAGGGFTTSEVAWGSFDQNSYATVTGLTETSFPFIPPAEMSTCTHYAD